MGLHENVSVVLLDELPYCFDKQEISKGLIKTPSDNLYSFYARCKGCAEKCFNDQCGFTVVSEVLLVRRRAGVSYND